MWAGGGAPSFFLLHVPHCCRCFLETPPRSFGSGQPAGLGPTQEALISRSRLLESGLATQAASPPPPPRHTHTSRPRASSLPSTGPSSRAWPASLPFQMESHQTELLRVFTHRWPGKAWLALKPLREKQGTVCWAALLSHPATRWKE